MKKKIEKDKLLAYAIKNFSEITQKTNNPSELAGRFSYDSGIEKKIWEDIYYKLQLDGIDNFLDIGCGCGGLTGYSIDSAIKNKYDLILLDFPAVIKKLKERYRKKLNKYTESYEGYFPYNFPDLIANKKFDRILVYSVIQYTDEPLYFIKKTIDLLNNRGIALFADIPNNNAKGRFITSEYGREFEANYQGVSTKDIPKYDSHQDYVIYNHQKNSKISDQMIIDIIKTYRSLGYNAFIVNQPSSLPFSMTREDLIIQKL